MRTYDRATFLAAQQAWDTGGFGWQWRRIREIASDRGMLFPPAGSRHDSRDAAEPSQRSIVWRALEDNPAELERIVRRSSSWSQVVDKIIGMESRLREDAGIVDGDAEWERGQLPTHREAVMSVARILARMDESR